MHNQDNCTEITFYYANGETEAFDISITPEAFEQQIQDLLSLPWLTMHLFDRTVIICTAQIMKIEVKPPISQIQGKGVFPEAQRVTALTHGVKS